MPLNNQPIHQLKGLRTLNRLELDRKLSKNFTRTSEGTLFDNKNLDIFFDLSQCRFCELGAIAKLTLIIDYHISIGDGIYIALPTLNKTDKEVLSKDFAEADKEHGIIRNRNKANRFLHTSGFVNAIQKSGQRHDNKKVFFTEDYNFESDNFNVSSFRESFSVIYDQKSIDDYEYKYLLPLRWIQIDESINSFDEVGREFDKILSNPERGIESLDVKTIKNVIISELIKNVKEHAEKSYALIGIGLIATRAYGSRDESDIENNYLKWVSHSGFESQVEICFGDTGVGILTEQFKAKYRKPDNIKTDYSKEQLKIAFQKWTSSKDNSPRRGTKGLYRILRIVNKYNGIIHVDTLNHWGGFQKGGKQEAKYLYRRNKAELQGTLINIKLNPYKQIRAFKYKLESNKTWKSWTSDKVLIDEELNCLREVKSKIQTSENLLLIIDIKDFEYLKNKEKLEKVFYEISRDAHPCAVVIYFMDNDQLDNDSISDILDSVNTRIVQDHSDEIFAEIATDDAEDIHDPVLVIGSNNQAFWYGGSKELIAVLKEGFKLDNKLESLQAFQILDSDLQTKIKLYLENDARLINIRSGELVYNFISIDKHYEQTVKQEVEASEIEYCSPKLQVTNYWINVKEVLEQNEYGFALSLYLKFRERFDLKDISRTRTYLMIDHEQQSKLARAFADLLGVPWRNIKNITTDLNLNVPRRTALFEANSNVIILTTVISSSETARRLVKYAKRDFANPIVVLSMGNFRKNRINHLETWNDTTAIISCYEHYDKEQPLVPKDIKYFESKSKKLDGQGIKLISPTFEIEDKLQKQPFEINSELLDILTVNKLLHYNHVGVYNSRHFTFYVNKKKLLHLQNSILCKKICSEIVSWTDGLSSPSRPYNIYIANAIYYDDSPFVAYLKNIPNSQLHKYETNLGQYINDSTVIYIDFGILTGESINRFIAKCSNVDNLLVLVIFNQGASQVTNIYDRISSLDRKEPLGMEHNKTPTNFYVKYLYDLPLNFYSSEDCPICEHRRALRRYKTSNDYLLDFSDDRRNRLNQRKGSEIHDMRYPVDFYFTEKKENHELSEIVIQKMYLLKILLENAKIYTSYRITLFQHIYQIYIKKSELINNCESELFSMLYYLSHEIHWFQIEPLVFRDFRILLSDISSFVACKKTTDLAASFGKTNRSNVTSESLAVRYKYAAISVLRSTNKLIFCESLYEIISSSLLHGRYSNNLLQNTLYHALSLIENSYNKSQSYYESIRDNLLRARDLEVLSIPQRLAIQKLLLLNSAVLKSIREPNPDKETERFEKMKRDWERLYNDTPNHPKPYQDLKVLNLRKHQSSFSAAGASQPDQRMQQLILDLMKNIVTRWNSVRLVLTNEIYYYLSSNLPTLVNSDFYRYYYDNQLNYTYFNRNADRFSELVLLVSKDPKRYTRHQEEYDRLYKYFEENYIRQIGLSNYKEDSTFLKLIKEIPSNLTHVLLSIFNESLFPKRSVNYCGNSLDEKVLVYFPKGLLFSYLEHVLDNLKSRLQKGFSLEEVDIRLNIESQKEGLVTLQIIYNGTENENDNPGHKKGGLNSWKKELRQFGGDLRYETPSLNQPNFVLTINFLQYGYF